MGLQMGESRLPLLSEVPSKEAAPVEVQEFVLYMQSLGEGNGGASSVSLARIWKLVKQTHQQHLLRVGGSQALSKLHNSPQTCKVRTMIPPMCDEETETQQGYINCLRSHSISTKHCRVCTFNPEALILVNNVTILVSPL